MCCLLHMLRGTWAYVAAGGVSVKRGTSIPPSCSAVLISEWLRRSWRSCCRNRPCEFWCSQGTTMPLIAAWVHLSCVLGDVWGHPVLQRWVYMESVEGRKEPMILSAVLMTCSSDFSSVVPYHTVIPLVKMVLSFNSSHQWVTGDSGTLAKLTLIKLLQGNQQRQEE